MELVELQPESSQLFSDNKDFIMKYKVDQSSIILPSFIVFHYYLVGGVDMTYYTTTNGLFNAGIKILQLLVFSLKMLYSNQ